MHGHPMHNASMKFAEYMAEANISDDAMAVSLKKDRTVIGRYRRGDVVPPLEVIAKIDELTGGRVSYPDFLSAPPTPEAAA